METWREEKMVRREGSIASGERIDSSVSETVTILFPVWQTSLIDLDILFCHT
jgi:hypothetical protein